MKRNISRVLRISLQIGLRGIFAWVYVAAIFRYLCDALHLTWNPAWWEQILGHEEHQYYLIQFLRSPEHMANSFYHLENLVVERIEVALEQKLLRFVTTLPIEETLPYLIFVIMVFLTVFYLFAYGRRFFGHLWILLHVFLLSVPFLFREIPGFLNFFTLVLLMLAMGGCMKERGSREMPELRYTGVLLVMVISCLTAERLMPQDKYQTLEKDIVEYKTELTKWGEHFFASAGEKYGQFPTSGKRIVDTEPVLEVTLRQPVEGLQYTENRSLYLKQYAGVHYGEKGWELYSEEEKIRLDALVQKYGWQADEWQLNPAITLAENESLEDSWLSFSMMGRMKEEPSYLQLTPVKNARGRVFALYGATDFGTDTKISSNYDLYVTGKGRRIQQEFTWYPNQFYIYGSWSIQESRYRPDLEIILPGMEEYQEFVYDTYLELPEGLGEGFYHVLDEVEETMRAGKLWWAENTDKCIRSILLHLWLEEYCSYELEPGKVPEGKNMVEYFLGENRKGYCVHFASAATLLLRAMGIPARYVEGYMIDKADLVKVGTEEVIPEGGTFEDSITYEIRKGTITGASAHAWVEVWTDDFGFVPLEYTPGSDPDGMGEDIGAGGGLSENASSEMEEDTDAPEEEKEEKEEKEEPVIPEEDRPEPEQEKVPEKAPEKAEVQTKKNDNIARIVLWVVAGVCLTGVAVAGCFSWCRLHYNQMSNRQRVLYWYGRLQKKEQRMQRKLSEEERVVSEIWLWWQSELERVQKLARKARFSDKEITEEEAEYMRACCMRLSEKAESCCRR